MQALFLSSSRVPLASRQVPSSHPTNAPLPPVARKRSYDDIHAIKQKKRRTHLGGNRRASALGADVDGVARASALARRGSERRELLLLSLVGARVLLHLFYFRESSALLEVKKSSPRGKGTRGGGSGGERERRDRVSESNGREKS